ncbi:hypothetical protein [Roseibacillus persicicus]|uniref:hypothetical protein n=1 Tax=Roseibacillus persicicus TaxID=454148 RepID=UPI00280FA4CE|nr:hypothetical protein [Roseibacillus persicicus]MDQ8190020.1 hypothetical protein [Roseibacillus persicicus]
MELDIPIVPEPPELPKAFSYLARLSALEAERTYQIRSGHFTILSKGLADRTFPLSDIVELRLRFQPTRIQTNRYECLLKQKNGQRIKIANELYQGIADFSDQSNSYREWIHHLVREVGYHSPNCRMVTGCTAPVWWGYLLMLLAVYAFLIALVIIFAMAIPAVAITKVVFMVVMTPLAFRWFRKNREQRFNATEIPKDVLPS